MIKELQSFTDDEGREFFVITPENSIEEVLIHLVAEVSDNPAEGLDYIDEIVEGLREDMGLPSRDEVN